MTEAPAAVNWSEYVERLRCRADEVERAVSAMIAGDRIKEMIPGTIDDRAIEFMQNHAPEIMGATLAATQLDLPTIFTRTRPQMPD